MGDCWIWSRFSVFVLVVTRANLCYVRFFVYFVFLSIVSWLL